MIITSMIKMKRKMYLKLVNKFKLLISVILIIIIIICSFILVNKVNSYKKAKNTYKELLNIKNELNDKYQILDSKLKAINKDYKMWIQVEGTSINYPVVQGADNEYYLNHDFNNNINSSGSIFIDYKNDIKEDKNIIVYGHNMKNKTMFQPLINFKEKQFFEKNKYIILTVNNKEYKYEIFSSYLIDANVDELKISFSSNEDFLNYIKQIKEKSLYNRNLNIKNDDKIITLSTCSYETKSTRIAVCGKLIK